MREPMLSRGLAGALAIGAALLCATPAHAAVGVCIDDLASKLAEATTEREAKRIALERWRNGARLIGEGYARWEISWRRHIDCRKLDDGRFQCQAIAKPCTIQHVPPSQFTPLKRTP